MGRVDQKIAVVTGGALGIGKAISELLAREGATVVIADILDEQGQAVAQAINHQGGRATYWHMDVAQEADVQRTLTAIAEQYGAIHILVNNAGIAGADKPPHEITEAEFDAILAVDVNALQLLLGGLTRQGADQGVDLMALTGQFSTQVK